MANLTQLVDKDVLKAHSKVSRWRSPLAIVCLYGVAALSVWLAVAKLGPWSWPAAVIVVGLCQHALFILLHDAAHYGAYPKRSVNDVIGDVLIGVPLGSRLKYYRALHNRHHHHVRDEIDPEMRMLAAIVCPSRGRAVLEALTGVTALRTVLWYQGFIRESWREGLTQGSALGDTLAFAAVWGPAVAVAAWTGTLWALGLFWVLPLAVVFMPLAKLQSYSDHTLELPVGESEFDRSLTRRFGFFADLIFNPFQAGEHLAHHLFPSVPWYNMPSFVRHLEGNARYQEESKKWYADGFFFGRFTVFEQVMKKSRLRPAGSAEPAA